MEEKQELLYTTNVKTNFSTYPANTKEMRYCQIDLPIQKYHFMLISEFSFGLDLKRVSKNDRYLFNSFTILLHSHLIWAEMWKKDNFGIYSCSIRCDAFFSSYKLQPVRFLSINTRSLFKMYTFSQAFIVCVRFKKKKKNTMFKPKSTENLNTGWC